MALTCRQAAGAFQLSATVGAEGASMGGLTVYNADSSPTTFTYNFIDSSEGDLSIVVARQTVPALRTAGVPLPGIVLNQGDSLQVTPSAGGGTHQYTYNYSTKSNAICKALKVTSTTPITLLENANPPPRINLFNNKNLLSDIPVFTFSNTVLSNITFKQSIGPYGAVGVGTSLPGHMLAGDSFSVQSYAGSSDFHLYIVY